MLWTMIMHIDYNKIASKKQNNKIALALRRPVVLATATWSAITHRKIVFLSLFIECPILNLQF